MILPLHLTLRDRITSALSARYDLDPGTMPTISIEYPPQRQLGDLATTVAFELARTLRKAPKLIAAELSETLGDLGGLGRVEATGAGYLNVFLVRV